MSGSLLSASALAAPAAPSAPAPAAAPKVITPVKAITPSSVTPNVKITPQQLRRAQRKGALQRLANPSASTKSNEPPLPPVTGKDGLIAKVNGTPVSLSDFQSKYDRLAQTFKRRNRPIPNRLAKRYRESILKRLVDSVLIDQEAKRRQVKVSNEDLEAEFTRYKEMFRTEERFTRYLESASLNAEQIRKNLQGNLILKALLAVDSSAAVTDEELQRYYDQNQNRYQSKEQVHARHILIKVAQDADEAAVEAAKQRALAALKRAREGEDFAALAGELSEGPTKSRGGDLGFFGRGQMVPPFEKAAFALEANKISEPVRTRFGWHIIKHLARKAGSTKSFDEVKESIRKLLTSRASRKARSTLLQRLRSEATIESYLPAE
ncbi:MAG: peptidylprolyl isomerase [Myxococcota bacterium]|nr:peptidylprolyl isomerase [Myxococcota bacterium]